MCRGEDAQGVVTRSQIEDAAYASAMNGAKKPIAAPDHTVHSIDASRELIIEGRVYDISAFASKHPGGSVIRYQLGTDATDAFQAFHMRSRKARMVLSSLPSRATKRGYKVDELSADYAKLKAELHAEGYFEPNLLLVGYRIAEVVALYAAGCWMVLQGWWWLGAFVMGIAQGRAGWLMHEGGHYSLTGNISIDRHLQSLFYGLGCGMSARYWRNQHNKHHATPQKLDADPDLQTLPLVAFHGLIGKRGPKAWLSWQAPLFFSGVITFLVAFSWQLILNPRHSLRVGAYLELVWLAVRYALWHHFFGYLGLAAECKLYVTYLTVGAAYIFINFAVSHTHKDVVPATKHLSWTLYSANHTVNCTKCAESTCPKY